MAVCTEGGGHPGVLCRAVLPALQRVDSPVEGLAFASLHPIAGPAMSRLCRSEK